MANYNLDDEEINEAVKNYESSEEEQDVVNRAIAIEREKEREAESSILGAANEEEQRVIEEVGRRQGGGVVGGLIGDPEAEQMMGTTSRAELKTIGDIPFKETQEYGLEPTEEIDQEPGTTYSSLGEPVTGKVFRGLKSGSLHDELGYPVISAEPLPEENPVEAAIGILSKSAETAKARASERRKISSEEFQGIQPAASPLSANPIFGNLAKSTEQLRAFQNQAGQDISKYEQSIIDTAEVITRNQDKIAGLNVDLANKKIELNAEYEDKLREWDKNHKQMLADESKRVDSAIDKFNSDRIERDSKRVDPDRYLNNRDRQGAAIAVAIGAWASAYTGQPNTALQILERNIDRDIEAQKIELDQSNRKVAESKYAIEIARTHFSDRNAQDLMAKSDLLDQKARQLSIYADELVPGIEKRNAEILADQLKQKANDAVFEARQRQMNANIGLNQMIYNRDVAAANRAAAESKARAMGEWRETAPGSELYYSGEKLEGKTLIKAQDAQKNYKMAKKALNYLRDFYVGKPYIDRVRLFKSDPRIENMISQANAGMGKMMGMTAKAISGPKPKIKADPQDFFLQSAENFENLLQQTEDLYEWTVNPSGIKTKRQMAQMMSKPRGK